MKNKDLRWFHQNLQSARGKKIMVMLSTTNQCTYAKRRKSVWSYWVLLLYLEGRLHKRSDSTIVSHNRCQQRFELNAFRWEILWGWAGGKKTVSYIVQRVLGSHEEQFWYCFDLPAATQVAFSCNGLSTNIGKALGAGIYQHHRCCMDNLSE